VLCNVILSASGGLVQQSVTSSAPRSQAHSSARPNGTVYLAHKLFDFSALLCLNRILNLVTQTWFGQLMSHRLRRPQTVRNIYYQKSVDLHSLYVIIRSMVEPIRAYASL